MYFLVKAIYISCGYYSIKSERDYPPVIHFQVFVSQEEFADSLPKVAVPIKRPVLFYLQIYKK
jgi:hypothetical protein